MYVVRPVVVATAHCLLRPRRTLLGCGSKRFCATAERRYEISVRAPAPSSTILARAVLASVIGPGRAAEDGSGLSMDPPSDGQPCVRRRKRAGNYPCATRIETACKRLWYSICTYCTGARPLLSRHSRARNQQKGNTEARQPVSRREHGRANSHARRNFGSTGARLP